MPLVVSLNSADQSDRKKEMERDLVNIPNPNGQVVLYSWLNKISMFFEGLDLRSFSLWGKGKGGKAQQCDILTLVFTCPSQPRCILASYVVNPVGL
jgi:hypothetical protein